MQLSISIKGQKYTKGKFGTKWSNLVNSTECNFFVKGEDEEFINEAVDLIPRFKAIKDRGGVRFKIRNKKFQGRAVKGVVMISPQSKTEIWLGKGKICDELFPRSAPVPEYKQNKKDALAAMRQIISPQISEFRKSVNRQLKRGKSLTCPVSKEFISCGEWHVDHVYPFKNLAEEWARLEKIDLERIEVYCRGTKCYFKNTELAESWWDFHQVNARLQALSAKANLAKGSKYYG